MHDQSDSGICWQYALVCDKPSRWADLGCLRKMRNAGSHGHGHVPCHDPDLHSGMEPADVLMQKRVACEQR